jgi:hypothetical protein
LRTRVCRIVCAALLIACSSDGGSGAGAATFRGEEGFLQGLDYDTGLLPTDSPAQVRVVAVGSGGVVVNARGTSDGGGLAPVAGSGSIEISGMLALRIFAKLDVRGITFDDMVHETSYAIPLASQPFEPFLVDETPVEARAELPPAEIARVPIPNVPGGTLVLNVTGGYVSSAFRGTCATALAHEAQYLGALTVAGELQASATIEVEVPIVGTQTFGPFDLTIPIPNGDRDLDLGTVDLATGARADSTRSLCDAIAAMDGSVGGDGGVQRRSDGGVIGGDAEVPMCGAAVGDCDRDPSNGCETPLDTTSDCGACGAACPEIANAIATCALPACSYECRAGASNCDGITENGCELSHASELNSCARPTDVGEYDGDDSCGFACPGNGTWDQFHRVTGTSSAWFKGRVHEQSTCRRTIEHRVKLEVPDGVDYDLFVYRPCGTMIGSSVRGVGMPDQVVVRSGDDIASDDSFDYWVEVRHLSGASCDPWTLVFEGHDC